MHFLIGCLKHAFYRFGIHCFPALPHHSPAFTLISNAFLFISTAFALHSPAFPWQSCPLHSILSLPSCPPHFTRRDLHSSAFHPIPLLPAANTILQSHRQPDAPRCAAHRQLPPLGHQARAAGGGANCATQPYSKNAPQEGFNFKPSLDFPFGLENNLLFPQTPIPR